MNFNTTLDRICSRKDNNVTLTSYLQKNLKEDNIHFKEALYEFLILKGKDPSSDFSERVIAVLFHHKLFNAEKIKKLFLKVKVPDFQRDDYCDYAHFRTFSIKGVELHLERLKKSNRTYLPINVIDREIELQEFFKNRLRVREVFILLIKGHYCPFLLEKFEERYLIYVTDSLGVFSDYAKSILNFIHQSIAFLNILPEQVTIFYTFYQRQKSSFGCEIYSIKDALWLALNPDQFKQQLISSGETFDSISMEQFDVIPFVSIPHKFMTMTESFEILNSYDETYKTQIVNTLKKKARIRNVDEEMANVSFIQKLKKYTYQILKSEDCLT